MAELQIAVLGTGMAGFGAGHVLHSAGVPFVCYDKNNYYGGHTRSIRYESGFVFDEGVHISFTRHEHVKRILAENIKDQYEERKFAIDNYWHGRRLGHPVQCYMHGLPVDLVVRVISDFVQSRSTLGDECKTYADWLYAAYGRTFAETFPIAYGNKYHTTSMDNLTTDWIGPRMYKPSLEDLLRGALNEPSPEIHYIQTYRYPSRGGFVSYLEPFAERFDLRLGHRLVGIDPINRVLRFSNGERHRYSAVISSIPLPELIPMVDGAPESVLTASRKLAFSTAVLFNIGLDRTSLSGAATTYFYDEDVIFSRINLPHMFAASNAPERCGGIQAEVYFSDKYKPLNEKLAALMERVVQDLRRCGFIKNEDRILLEEVSVNRYANVIYDFDRSAALGIVHQFLDDARIDYCGRYGDWNHAWTDEAFISGEQRAKRVLARLAS